MTPENTMKCQMLTLYIEALCDSDKNRELQVCRQPKYHKWRCHQPRGFSSVVSNLVKSWTDESTVLQLFYSMVAFLENSGYVKPWHWQKIFDVFRWSQEIISSPASCVRHRSPGMPASAHWVPQCSPPPLGRPRTFPAPAVWAVPRPPHRTIGADLQPVSEQATLLSVAPSILNLMVYLHFIYIIRGLAHWEQLVFFSNLCTSSAISLGKKGGNTSTDSLLTSLNEPCYSFLLKLPRKSAAPGWIHCEFSATPD